MTPPGTGRLMRAMATTWPAFATRRLGPFTLREGRGAGRRVSAATADGPASPQEIAAATQAMRDMGQVPIFCLTEQQAALESALVAAGATERLDVTLLVAPVANLAARDQPRVAALPVWPPFAIMDEMWETAGIGAARRAVMARAPDPKTAILMRTDDKPAGTAFVACDTEVAIVHAMVTRPALRRRGSAANAMTATARWAAVQGAAWMGLAATAENGAALALYEKLGMKRAGGYHYRTFPEESE